MATAEQVALKLQGSLVTEEDLLQAIGVGALRIEAKAKKNAPVLTGALRRNIGTEVKVESPTRVVALIGNSTAIPYARMQEFAGRKKGYLRGALRSEASRAVADISSVLKSKIGGRS